VRVATTPAVREDRQVRPLDRKNLRKFINAKRQAATQQDGVDDATWHLLAQDWVGP
jgi:hypothetical protein